MEQEKKTAAETELVTAEWVRGEMQRALEALRGEIAEERRVKELPEEERADYALKKREEALLRREKEVAFRELRAEATEELRRRKLPEQLADALDYTDGDCCRAAMDRVEAAFREAVRGGVEQRLGGGIPQGARVTSEQGLSDAEYYRGLAL